MRSIFAVLGSFVVLTNLLEAQVSKPQSAGDRQQPTNDTGTSVGLLQQSHDLDNPLPMPTRVVLLPRQAEMVSHLNPNLGREWANELFALALQVKGKRRSQLQSSALGILIRLDPDRALDLLHQLSTEDPDFTIPFVEGLPTSQVKAEVLLDAASALSTSRPPHIGTQPQQTAEKPNP